MADPVTHKLLVQAAAKWLRSTQKCSVVLAEMVCYAPSIPDAIGWQSANGGWSILVECKVSRSDFLADRKKLIHALPDSHPGQERWYFTPKGLLDPRELPEGWRLAEYHAGRVYIRTLQSGPRFRYQLVAGRAQAEVPFLVSALRRHQIGVPFDAESARFETVAVGNKRRARRSR